MQKDIQIEAKRDGKIEKKIKNYYYNDRNRNEHFKKRHIETDTYRRRKRN